MNSDAYMLCRGDWPGAFQFQHYKGRVIAVIHNIKPRNVKGVLSAADLTHSRDKMDEFTIAATASKNWEEASGLAFLRVVENM